MREIICENCNNYLMKHEAFCPYCGIQNVNFKSGNSDYTICKICGAKNAISEKKCSSCCSILSVKDLRL